MPPTRSPVTIIGGHDQHDGEAGRDGQLGEGDPPARDGLDQEEDRGPVLDLGPDRGRPDDERDQRQHGPDDEGIEDGAGVAAPAGDADEQRHDDRQRDEQQHQEEAPPAQQPAQRDRDQRRRDGHRRTR